MNMQPPAPIAPEPDFDSLPKQMITARRWVLWRYSFLKDKWTKIPWNTNRKASSTNPDTWMSFEEVKEAYQTKKYAGIGFVLGWDDTIDKNWLGVDLDKVYDPDTDVWSMPEWRDLVYGLDTYTEFSPSGTGIHAIGWGEKTGEKCQKKTDAGDIEFYDKGRYFTVTGRRIEAVTAPDIKDVNPAALAEVEGVVGHVPEKKTPQVSIPDIWCKPQAVRGVKLNEDQKSKLPKPEDIISMIRASSSGDDFTRLYDKGDFSKYQSRSEAVFSLIGMVHWWTRDVPTTFIIMSKAAILDGNKWSRLGYKEVSKVDQETIYDGFPPWVDVVSPARDVAPVEDKDDIKNLRFTINVPEDHFISKYVAHWTGRNDAYPDYHYASALSLLSIAANRVVGVNTKNMGVIRTNLWILMLGVSSFSRKTTAIRPVRRFANAGTLNQLPDTFTPESLIEDLANNQKAYHLKDECAQILNGMNKKTYMSDLRDLFCSLYDGDPFTRKLKSKIGTQTIFKADAPYLSMQWATTPDNFYKSTTILDSTSGFLLRFMPVFPQYRKGVMGIEMGNPDIEYGETSLMADYERLVEFINDYNNITAAPTERGLKLFNDWFIAKQLYYEDRGDEYKIHQSILARIIPVVLKIAANLTLGDAYIRELIDIDSQSRVSITIPDEYVHEAIREVDEYFLPMMIEIMTQIERRGVENIQERIINNLKTASGYRMNWSDMMRKIRAPNKKAFADAISFMEESGEVVVGETGEGKGLKKFIQLIVSK